MPDFKIFGRCLFIPLLLISCLHNNSFAADTGSVIGIRNFQINPIDSTSYQNLHISLYKRLLYESLPYGIRPEILHNDYHSDYISVVSGTIDLENDTPVLHLVLSGPLSNERETKSIPLKGMEIEQILDIIILKIRYFLEQNVSGKLRISSTPLGCSVLLNGITIGTTPAELTLEKGTYVLKLQHDHLYTFIDTVEITSGTELSVQPNMRFEGFKQTPWLLSATLLTVGTSISWIIEGSLHKSYKNLPLGESKEVYNQRYLRYRNANYFRIGLLNATALCWTVNGFIIVSNNSIKKKIFGK